MRDIPEAEARALFDAPLYCEDANPWGTYKGNPSIVEITAGLLDTEGRSAGLLLSMIYHSSPKTRIRTCKFTVYVRRPYGNDRAYQLELNQYPVRLEDVHKRSHEHIGRLRVTGDASWEGWEYDDAIAHFCKQTNITFRPPLPHPEHFYLR